MPYPIISFFAFYPLLDLSLFLEFFNVQVFFNTTFVNLFTFTVISKRAGFVISAVNKNLELFLSEHMSNRVELSHVEYRQHSKTKYSKEEEDNV